MHMTVEDLVLPRTLCARHSAGAGRHPAEMVQITAETEALFMQHLPTIDRIIEVSCVRSSFDRDHIEDASKRR
jgi:hypothetical protein